MQERAVKVTIAEDMAHDKFPDAMPVIVQV